jgi:hypothetical protein
VIFKLLGVHGFRFKKLAAVTHEVMGAGPRRANVETQTSERGSAFNNLCCTYAQVYMRSAAESDLVQGSKRRDCQMRTLTGYGIAVVIVLAILNGIFWLAGKPQLHDLNIFSAGFVLGMLGMYIAAWLYGYRQF